MLALPFAYSQLNVHGRAAVLYGQAVNAFGVELEKVNASIERIRMGNFLEALTREEIRQDKDWVVHLRSLPEAPETFYLLTLMASHDFQTALQNYLDLEDLRSKLVTWQRSLDSFEDIIALRHAYYEPLLPEIDRQFRKLDAQVRLRQEQRKHVDQRLQQMLIIPNSDSLTTSEERRVAVRLEQLASELQNRSDPESEALRRRLDRLRGALTWNVETQYHQRLTEAHEHLRELNEDMETLTARYDAFVRARQAATHSYVGYEVPINRLRSTRGRGARAHGRSSWPSKGTSSRASQSTSSQGAESASRPIRTRRVLRSRTAMTEPRRRRHGEVEEAMRCTRTVCLLVPTLVVGCASPGRHTLAELETSSPT